MFANPRLRASLRATQAIDNSRPRGTTRIQARVATTPSVRAPSRCREGIVLRSRDREAIPRGRPAQVELLATWGGTNGFVESSQSGRRHIRHAAQDSHRIL